jgi:regulator of replication initiation timing
MTFAQTMETIYSIFCQNIGNVETIELCREIEKPLEALQAEYDRLLEENNQLRVENVELEKRIEELE